MSTPNSLVGRWWSTRRPAYQFESARWRLAARAGRIVALAIIYGFSAAAVVWSLSDWGLWDMEAYWTAGTQWRLEGNPYALGPETTTDTVYRYAPWFAALWVPLTLLPRSVVEVGWSAVLVAAAVGAVWPIRRSAPLLALMGSFLFSTAQHGNIQPLMLAWMVYGLPRRSAPLWIALAASLKAVPLALVLVYLGRREWWRAGVTIALTAALAAPALLFERPALTTAVGRDPSLLVELPVVGVPLLVGAVVVSLALAASRYAWLAAATAAVLALPRLFLYDITLLLVGTVEAGADSTSRARNSRQRIEGETTG